MNRKNILAYFKKAKDRAEVGNEVQTSHILSRATENVSEAELSFAEEELKRSYIRPKTNTQRIYQRVLKSRLVDMPGISEQQLLSKRSPSSTQNTPLIERK